METIAAAIIAKGPSAELETAKASISPLVDETVVYFTGSRERPNERAIADGVSVKEDCHSRCGCQRGDIVDFAAARNASLALAKSDWIVWLDSDDRIEWGKDPDVLRKFASQNTETGRPGWALYRYGAGSEFWLPRLFPKAGRNCWRQPIHEYLDTPGWDVSSKSDIPGAIWAHCRTQKSDWRRNLRIARHWETNESFAQSARFHYYLGQSLREGGETNAALASYRRSYELQKEGAEEQRFLSAKYCVDLSLELKQPRDAVSWAYRALDAYPMWRDGYFLLGKSYYFLYEESGRLDHAGLSIRNFQIGLALHPAQSVIFPIANDWRPFEIHRYLSSAFHAIGDFDRALESTEAALSDLDHPTLRSNAAIYKKHIEGQPKVTFEEFYAKLGERTP